MWDASCPRVWSKWETNGQKWVIQDLDVDDFENALNILLEELCCDEVLCACSDIQSDAVSMAGMEKFWRECLTQRMSLALYTWIKGVKTLAALNVCVVASAGEIIPNVEIEGEKWMNVYSALAYIETKQDPHKYTGIDTLLHAFGLLVKREFRGLKLGGRLLMAREPLCKYHGIKGTTTVFTGPASQKVATVSGFHEISKVSMKELAETGLDYPPDDNRFIKLMIKLYD